MIELVRTRRSFYIRQFGNCLFDSIKKALEEEDEFIQTAFNQHHIMKYEDQGIRFLNKQLICYVVWKGMTNDFPNFSSTLEFPLEGRYEKKVRANIVMFDDGVRSTPVSPQSSPDVVIEVKSWPVWSNRHVEYSNFVERIGFLRAEKANFRHGAFILLLGETDNTSSMKGRIKSFAVEHNLDYNHSNFCSFETIIASERFVKSKSSYYIAALLKLR